MLKLTLLAMLSSVRALVRSPLPRGTARSFHRGAPLRMGLEKLEGLRNVAIVAHVDHGKTTLVDAMLQQSDVFRANEEVQERVMDSNDQERERGITILAKNAAITYKGVKFNLVDTPGHADFGGEVERILNMVDGVLLVVDSVEGPKPQTRFVLKKALELGKQANLVINKIDRPNARPDYVIDQAFDLFCELGASDEQCEAVSQPIFTSALQGIAGDDHEAMTDGMTPLFDRILDMPKPAADVESSTQLLVANIDFDQYKGKLGIGRLTAGKLRAGQTVGAQLGPDGERRNVQVKEVFIFDNLGRKQVDEATAGEIVMFSGVTDIGIGETLVDPADPRPLPAIAVEEPTVKMTFAVNKSPLAGKEGDKLTSRLISDRLTNELERNVALRVEPAGGDVFEVSGRGQLHLSVLIETMRREGFELQIGPPSVIRKTIDGQSCEPFESVEVQVPSEYQSACVDLLNNRKGEMQDMGISDDGSERAYVKFAVPTRGMIGLRNQLLTATRGTAVIDTVFDSYKPDVGEIASRDKGSLLAYEGGEATSHGITGAQDRGQLFCDPKTKVYKDMIVGVHQRPGDLRVNVCKQKQLTNMRSATKGIVEGLVPPLEMNLDIAIEYINADELVEVTPENIRMLKKPGWDAKVKGQKAKGSS